MFVCKPDTLVYQINASFYAVGTVGGRFELRSEQFELLEPSHVRISALLLVHYELSGVVDRLQVAFYSYGLVGLFARVGGNRNKAFFRPDFLKNRNIHLFVESVLQGIVFDVIKYLRSSANIIAECVVPSYKFDVGDLIEVSGIYVKFTVAIAY